MSYRITYLTVALEDVRQAHRWYDTEQPGLGRRFRAAVWCATAGIAEHPRAYPAYYGTARRALVSRFPYGVFYEVHDRSVTVLAVLNLRRDLETIDSVVTGRR